MKVGDRVQFRSTRDPATGTVIQVSDLPSDGGPEEFCLVDWDDGRFNDIPQPSRVLIKEGP